MLAIAQLMYESLRLLINNKSRFIYTLALISPCPNHSLFAHLLIQWAHAENIVLRLEAGGGAIIEYQPHEVHIGSRNTPPCLSITTPPHAPQVNPALEALLPLNITDPMEDDGDYEDALASATPIVPQALLDAALGMPPLEGWPSACDSLLEIPKVALLFLTPGRLPHERIWRAMLAGVTGAIPAALVHEYSRGGWFGSLQRRRLRALQHACGKQAADAQLSIVDRQFLFSVYVHHHPRFAGYRLHSMFRDRAIPIRMDARR